MQNKIIDLMKTMIKSNATIETSIDKNLKKILKNIAIYQTQNDEEFDFKIFALYEKNMKQIRHMQKRASQFDDITKMLK